MYGRPRIAVAEIPIFGRQNSPIYARLLARQGLAKRAKKVWKLLVLFWRRFPMFQSGCSQKMPFPRPRADRAESVQPRLWRGVKLKTQ